jgi:hypothetical protein
MTPLMIACSDGYCCETIELLATQYQADVNAKNHFGETAIMIAAKGDRYDAMMKLFKVYGKDQIDLNIQDNRDGKTLQEVIFEKGLYRASLKSSMLPESWKKHKADWDIEKRKSKKIKK